MEDRRNVGSRDRGDVRCPTVSCTYTSVECECYTKELKVAISFKASCENKLNCDKIDCRMESISGQVLEK